MPGSGRFNPTRGGLLRWLLAIVFIIGLCGVLTARAGTDTEAVTLVLGRSVVVTAPWPTVRVAVTDPTVANVQVLTPEQVLVQGLKVGTTDIILWNEDESQTWQRRVVVSLDVEKIRATLADLFPTAELTVDDSDDVLLVRGLVRSADQAEQLHEFLGKSKIEYVDMTSVAGVQQVQLQVRVAEVSRDALRQLGMNWFAADEDFFFGQQLGDGALANVDIGTPGGLVDSDLSWVVDPVFPGAASNVFLGFPNSDLAFYMRALSEDGYLRILANPTLVALSGEEATFLAGGEYPIPVIQGSSGGAAGGNNAITIEYKEYGVRLTFLPQVLGDGGIRLRAAQEVSQLSDAGAVTIGTVVVPALVSRRAETTMELKSGQSFAMAGLLQRTDTVSNSRLPGLGDLPVVGALFRSVRYQEEETELVILVTAALVEPISPATTPPMPGVTYTAPNDWELYIEGRLEGKTPVMLDAATMKWMKDAGLDHLVGPGAWASYGTDQSATTEPGESAEPSGPMTGEGQTEESLPEETAAPQSNTGRAAKPKTSLASTGSRGRAPLWPWANLGDLPAF